MILESRPDAGVKLPDGVLYSRVRQPPPELHWYDSARLVRPRTAASYVADPDGDPLPLISRPRGPPRWNLIDRE